MGALVLILLLIINSGRLGVPADQLFSAAASNLSSAPAVKMSASYTQQGTRYTISWTVPKDGGMTGSVSARGSTVDLTSVDGKAWVRTDKAYWDNLGRTDALAQKVLPGHWVILPATDPLSREIESATSMRSLLQAGHTDLKKGGTQIIAGKKTVELSDSHGQLYVTTATPNRLVRMVYAPGYTDPSGISGLDAAISYPRGVDITPPSQYYDTKDPNTLPAMYTVDNAARGQCDQNGCAYTITVHNHYGQSGGQATVSVQLTTQDGTSLGSCTAPIPPIGYDQTEDVSCTVQGAAWTDFYNGGTGTLQWFRQTPVHNPIWDD
ncbi:MAG: hypothetical protein J2P45_13995 [Candidatus Dormibacteraeota bacterium]|nr:hypothetical protein [Candidatus Dormibacteraeota bacterium]